MKKIKVGIIGMGYIGESHIEAVRRIGCCELYAVADTNAELAKAKAEYYGVENAIRVLLTFWQTLKLMQYITVHQTFCIFQ